ncbi:hypothetical protein PR048_029558, partial [Dryococelus australis]
MTNSAPRAAHPSCAGEATCGNQLFRFQPLGTLLCRVQIPIDAALTVNPKLKLNPRNQDVVLHAITRIDLSRNSLTWVPAIIFQLHSL